MMNASFDTTNDAFRARNAAFAEPNDALSAPKASFDTTNDAFHGHNAAFSTQEAANIPNANHWRFS
jgi:hypothetical protein